MKVKQIILFTVCIALCLGGCSRKNTDTVGYDIDTGIYDLDPQFSEDKWAGLVLVNIFEGLVVESSGGKLLPGAAESWELSEDGLEYTFYLREDNLWPETENSKKLKVTADDFVFAFVRLFNPEAPSPYAKDYLAIKGAQDILAGNAGMETLGVSDEGEYTLKITLEHPDPMFMYKLAQPPAMPCDNEFFAETKGKYGLEKNLIIGNGAYKLIRWEKDNRLTLEINEAYYNKEKPAIKRAEIFVDRPEPVNRFNDGYIDFLKLEADSLEKLEAEHITKPFGGTVWCIGFNAKGSLWSVPFMAEALDYAINRDKLEYNLNKELAPVYGLLLGENGEPMRKEPYRELSPVKSITSFNAGKDILGQERIAGATLYYPAGADSALLEGMCADWKEILDLNISLKEIPKSDYNEFLRKGEYELALIPVTPSRNGLTGALEHFKADSAVNYIKYNSPVFDSLTNDVYDQLTDENMQNKAEQAERQILEDGAVIPLYSEKSYYAVTPKGQTADIYPLEGKIRFYGEKEKSE